MENLLLWGFYVMTFYAFLPGLVSRTFGFRVFKRGDAQKEIALTFDDGPDPVYTKKLLDLLAHYDAKATFFVVGTHAEKEPELLKRMVEEGHVIGVHNYVHKSNWLMRPKTVKRQIDRTNDVIEAATGKRSIYYRPPWGIVNLFDYSNLGHMQIILWSALFGDWRIRVGAKGMEKRLMKKLRPGEVLLLHDCGRTLGADIDAPANMLAALKVYLEAAKQKGYSFVSIDHMIKLTDANRLLKLSPIKRLLISLWLGWEKLFHAMFRLKQVGDRETPTFYYRITPYTGQRVELAEGGQVEKGDQIAELHFDNKMLSTIAVTSKTPLAAGLRMLREIEYALPQLADQLAADPEAQNIKAVYGVTMIHRGADRLGFQVIPIPDGMFARASSIYLNLLMKVLTNPKLQNKRKSSNSTNKKLTPRILLMPTQVVKKYATTSLNRVQEEAGRLGGAVERSFQQAADETAALGTKTVI